MLRDGQRQERPKSAYELNAEKTFLEHLERYGPDSEAARAVARVMNAKGHEQVLGVAGSVLSSATLKKAYHQRCLEFHPDKNHAKRAEEAFN